MKITDKIVTLVKLPSMTNVVWHNPDTNELKIYSKNGWEVVGGSPGGLDVNTLSKGYPIVNASFNSYNKIGGVWEPDGSILINAQPNTSYNIPELDLEQNPVMICFNPFQLSGVSGKYLMFSFDDTEDGSLSETIMVTSYIGVIQTENNDISTKELYPYKLVIPMIGNDFTVLVSSDITTSTNTIILAPALSDTPIPINNIKVKEAHEYCLINGFPLILKEVENDNSEYEHKYVITDTFLNMQMLIDPLDVYTYEEKGETFIVFPEIEEFGIPATKYPLIKMNAEESVENTGEYIFNFKTPLTLEFGGQLLWNNGNEPDLTQPGLMTISIVNGVGCYTFVPE